VENAPAFSSKISLAQADRFGSLTRTMNNNDTTITNEAVRKMIREWLTGDDERDAQRLRRKFRSMRMPIEQWRQVIAETKSL